MKEGRKEGREASKRNTSLEVRGAMVPRKAKCNISQKSKSFFTFCTLLVP
jgi:hypothetical protein